MLTNKKLIGYAAVLASALCFASYGVWSKFLGGEFGVYSQAWVRSVVILLFLVPLGIATKSYKKIARKDWRLFAPTIFFTVFSIAPIYYAFNHMSLGAATLIFYALFLVTSYAVGWLAMKERFTVTKFAAFALAIAGLALTYGFSIAVFSVVAVILAAVNGIASGGEVAFSKWVTDKYSTIQVTTLCWISILVTHLPLAFITQERFVVPQWNESWLAMLAYAFTGLMGFWLVIEGFKYIDASVGGLIGLTEIVFSIGFGLVVFHEHLTLAIAVGAILILLAGILPDIMALRNKDKPAELPNLL